jgi:type I restriction enzyme, S subunit
MTLPEGWETATIGDVTEPVSKRRPDEEPEREFTYIDISSIENQAIINPKRLLGSDAPSRARQVVNAGDTVLSTVRTYLKHTALVPEDLDDAVASTGFCVLRPAPAVDPKFLLFRVLEQKFVDDLSKKQSGSSYPAVRDADVREMPIDLPPLDEQQRIVAAIGEQFLRLDASEGSLKSGLARIRTAWRAGVMALMDPGWPQRPVDEVADVRGGILKNPSRRPVKHTAPFLRVANVLRGKLDLTDVHRIEVFEGDLQKYALTKGDLLVVEGNGSFEQIGRSALWDGSIPGCVHQNHLIRVRPSRDHLVPEFLGICWNSPVLAGRIASAASSTSGLYSLSTGKVAGVLVPCPPLTDQESVIQTYEAFSSRLDAVGKEIRLALDRSRRLRMSVLHAAFEGELLHSRSAMVAS